ncbi:MAG: AMP-binding protein, partial [Desulfobacterales bacterium]|nr:AMP-binding protein [Desulfobacterales bacterium]
LPSRMPDLDEVVPFFEGSGAQVSYGRLMAQGRERPCAPLNLSPDETMGLIYTSGTTGNPKGVVLTHANMLTEIQSLVKAFEKKMLVPDDMGLSFLPWGHLMGQLEEVHILIYSGYASALVRDLKEIPQDLADVKPTIFFGVPRLYTKLYERIIQAIEEKPKPIQWLFHHGVKGNPLPGLDHRPGLVDRLANAIARRIVFPKIRAIFGGRLRLAFSGGAALNESVVAFFDAVGIPIHEGYGMTETTMAVTMNSPEARKLGSVGKIIPKAQVSIDPDMEDMKEGEGEIIVHGPLLMKEYHNLPEETAAVFTPDGGFRTGDVGRMDEEGFLYLTGRIKELYKMENGKYVSPGPLEEELKFSPYINQVLISGENQRYNVALVTPEMEPLMAYADSMGLDTEDPAWKDSGIIQALFEKEIETYSGNFKKFERPGKFKIVWEDWSMDTRLITPTLKLKRRQITEKYKGDIQSLYS